MAKILMADPVYMNKRSLAILKKSGSVEAFKGTTKKELLKQAADSDVIVTEYTPVDAEIFKHARKLKAVLVFGVGYNHVDVGAASRRKIYVANCKGLNSEAVAELVFFKMLDLCRKGSRADTLVREGGWTTTVSGDLPTWLMGSELLGKTLGIIGLGEIGRRVARIASGFRMNVLAVDPYVDAARAREEGARMVDISTLFKTSDFITIHVPLGQETRRLLGKREIALMKRTAILINAARGGVVDEPALISALKSGRIAGAALDVFAEEPISQENELLNMKNVSLSPHVGGHTREALDACAEQVATNAQQVMSGRLPQNIVNLAQILE